jgi:hypothetical protein
MLGLKPGKLTALSANETRFDISLPIYESQLGGMMQVSPRPMDGQLTIKDTATGEVVNIDVGVILPGPPGMFGADNLKARIVSKWLELVVTMGSNAGFSATVNCAVDEPITLSDLHFVNKVQRLISSEKGLMELRRQRKKVIVTEYSADSDPGLRSNFQFSRELLSTVDLIITKAGLPPASVRLTIEEINSQLGAIQFVHDLIAGPSSVKLNAFRIRTIDGYPQDLRRCEMLAIGRIMFTSHYIGFCAMGECTIDGVESIKTVTVDGLSLRELVILDTSEESFREFVGEMQAETGLSLVLRWEARPSISREQLTMPQERRKW